MSILENLPFRRVIYDSLFVLVGLAVRLKIHRMSQILLSGEYMRDGAGIPFVIVCVGSIVWWIKTHILSVSSRILVATFHKFLGDLCRTKTLHA
ncbi:hypothetical protein SDC9_91493 [bioreactor metagenome]|uniref:Uncharacterized protein n=1 Tax=bioreactor metagenome TaxID=1076179 RepID=A0A644ZXZ8_9ZZZZ